MYELASSWEGADFECVLQFVVGWNTPYVHSHIRFPPPLLHPSFVLVATGVFVCLLVFCPAMTGALVT